MIAKKYRFQGHNSLRYLFKNGKTIRRPILTVRYISNPRTEHYRAAVIVSKKVAKSAPKRNRIRRRIYEIIRLYAPDHLSKTDIAVIVFSDTVATMPYQELESNIKNILLQIQRHS